MQDAEQAEHEFLANLLKAIPVIQKYSRRKYRHLSDDLSQETFIRAWKAQNQYKKGTKLITWLFQIVDNLARDIYRKEQVRKKIPVLKDIEDCNPVEIVDLLSKIDSILVDESPVNKKVFKLLREGHSYKEISEQLKIPENTIKTKLRRMFIKIKESVCC